MHCTEDKVPAACCTGTSIQDVQKLRSKATLECQNSTPFLSLKMGGDAADLKWPTSSLSFSHLVYPSFHFRPLFLF